MNTFALSKLSFDKDSLLELALKQIDNTGFQLQHFGITDQFNRHNCIAVLMTEEKRLRGELDRLAFRVDRQKVKLNKVRSKIDSVVETVFDQAIEYAPSPLTSQLERLKAAVL